MSSEECQECWPRLRKVIRHVERGDLTHSAISRRLWISCAMISHIIRPQAREKRDRVESYRKTTGGKKFKSSKSQHFSNKIFLLIN